MSSARRELVREVAHLVRAPEPGSNNLGEFVAGHADELAQVLDADPHWLAVAHALDDEELLPGLVQLLDRARRRRVCEDADRRRERSIVAAARLGQSARWTELGAELDVDLLLGEVLADRTRKWLTFEAEGMSLTVPRHLIAATAPLARHHLDLAAYVDEHALHFRWRGGRGRYNWRAHDLRPGLEPHVLTVALAPRAVLPGLPEPRVCRPCRVRPVLPSVAAANDVIRAEHTPVPDAVVVADAPERRRGGAWLRDILRELGHV